VCGPRSGARRNADRDEHVRGAIGPRTKPNATKAKKRMSTNEAPMRPDLDLVANKRRVDVVRPPRYLLSHCLIVFLHESIIVCQTGHERTDTALDNHALVQICKCANVCRGHFCRLKSVCGILLLPTNLPWLSSCIPCGHCAEAKVLLMLGTRELRDD